MLFKYFFLIILLNFAAIQICAQENLISIPLRVVNDSRIYQYYYIQPNSVSIKCKIPENFSKYTTSRYLDFKSIGTIIPVLIGQTTEGKHAVMFDLNMNFDFTDDDLIYFEGTNSENNENIKNQNLFIPGYKDSISISYTIIKPANLKIGLPDKIEEQFYLSIKPNVYWIGETVLNNKKRKIYLFNQRVLNFTPTTTAAIILESDSELTGSILSGSQLANKIKLGDKFNIDGQLYHFKGISSFSDTLFLVNNLDSNSYGSSVGFRALEIADTSISGELVSHNDFRGKYLLIDFWGTWCLPCHESLKYLKILYKEKKSIAFLGIALDANKKVVEKYVRKNEVEWPQILQNINDSSKAQIVEKYGIKNYPTFILLDKSGRIIFRDTGLEGLDRLKIYVKNI